MSETKMAKQYILGKIRAFLTDGFSVGELRDLCFDTPDFKHVCNKLSDSTGKTEFVQQLLEYAERKNLLDTLLAEAEKKNSAMYIMHQPYYTQRIQVYLQEVEFSSELRNAAIHFFAAIREKVKAIEIHHVKGSMVFEFGAPPDGIQHLRSHLQESDGIGPFSVKEVSIENVQGDWENIGETATGGGWFEFIPFSEFSNRVRATNERILSATNGEMVKFVAITGRGFICKPSRPADPNIFVEAITKGVIFNGILLDPESRYAEIRSEIESPNTPMEKRLLKEDSDYVRKWLSRNLEDLINAKKKENVAVTKPSIKYCSLPLPFSLWLFNDFALVEPYHFGKFPEEEHLCGFGSIRIRKGTHEYEALERHFKLLWSRSQDIQ